MRLTEDEHARAIEIAAGDGVAASVLARRLLLDYMRKKIRRKPLTRRKRYDAKIKHYADGA